MLVQQYRQQGEESEGSHDPIFYSHKDEERSISSPVEDLSPAGKGPKSGA